MYIYIYITCVFVNICISFLSSSSSLSSLVEIYAYIYMSGLCTWFSNMDAEIWSIFLDSSFASVIFFNARLKANTRIIKKRSGVQGGS